MPDTPVAITVEGANILTRSLITFAQGALRSHPYLYQEIEAVQNPDRAAGFLAFEKAFEAHVAFLAWRTSSARFSTTLPSASSRRFRKTRPRRTTTGNFTVPRRISRWWRICRWHCWAAGLRPSSAPPARLADALSELYFICCLLKRYEDDGKLATELPVFDYSVQKAFHGFYAALHEAISNFPVLAARPLLKFCVFPLGNHFRKPKDSLAKTVVRAVLEPGEVRDRLTRYIFVSHDENDSTGLLEAAMLKVVEADEADRKLERAVRQGVGKRYLGGDWFKEAQEKGVLRADEADLLRYTERLVEKVIAVDDFEAEAVQPHFAQAGDVRAALNGAAAPAELHAAE